MNSPQSRNDEIPTPRIDAAVDLATKMPLEPWGMLKILSEARNIERELTALRSSAVSEKQPLPNGCVAVPIETLNQWGEAIQPYQFDGSYNNEGVISTMAEMATYATKGHGHG